MFWSEGFLCRREDWRQSRLAIVPDGILTDFETLFLKSVIRDVKLVFCLHKIHKIHKIHFRNLHKIHFWSISETLVFVFMVFHRLFVLFVIIEFLTCLLYSLLLIFAFLGFSIHFVFFFIHFFWKSSPSSVLHPTYSRRFFNMFGSIEKWQKILKLFSYATIICLHFEQSIYRI